MSLQRVKAITRLLLTVVLAVGIEEALVATMVVQESFIRDFGLNDMTASHRADITGNVVAMSQLGCIAGALS